MCVFPLQYAPGSAPALAIEATIERTKARFANYAKSGVACGKDGLPHLIAEPYLALTTGHWRETLVRFFPAPAFSCKYSVADRNLKLRACKLTVQAWPGPANRWQPLEHSQGGLRSWPCTQHFQGQGVSWDRGTQAHSMPA